MTELEELRAVVLAQSKLLGLLVANLHVDEQPSTLTSDQGYEMLDDALGNLDPELRRKYFAKVDCWYPRHSTE